jgi:glycine C-acetyltransferase
VYEPLKAHIDQALKEIRDGGFYKEERVISSPQGPRITVSAPASADLGLANDPRVVAAAKESFDRWGYGLSSVRFICGTQEIHKQLEAKLSEFLGTEDTILYSSCFDANGGLFETLLGPEDAIISDELNHASIIDGVRLCKAMRYRYKNRDMRDLEEQLRQSDGAKLRLIATDGVFSMDGTIAPLDEICDLADEHHAAVMIDDSHATAVLGKRGRGTHEYRRVEKRIDIITGTLGKALGGASGGFTSGRKEIIELLRQRSRPYLFSNTLAPAIAATTLVVLDILTASTELRDRLAENTEHFRDGMAQRGFNIPQSEHPICPILLGDAARATKMAKLLFDEGVYVTAFSYPVVPKDKARIRVQISAAHTKPDLDFAMNAFAKVRKAVK